MTTATMIMMMTIMITKMMMMTMTWLKMMNINNKIMMLIAINLNQRLASSRNSIYLMIFKVINF